MQQLVAGAEVAGQVLQFAGQRTPLDRVVDRHVGAAEAVDRLLGVADHEQAAGLGRERAPVAPGARRGAQPGDELGLDGVGVLELVHQDPTGAAVKVVAHVVVVAQQVARPQEQVVEVGHAVGAAVARVGLGEILGEGKQADQGVGAQGRSELLEPRAVLGQDVPHPGARALIPVARLTDGESRPRSLEQDQALDLVAIGGALDLALELEDLLEVAVRRVLGGVAARLQLLQLSSPMGQRCLEGAHIRHGRLRFGQRQRLAVAVHRLDQPAQGAQLQAAAHRPFHRFVALGQLSVEPTAIGLLEPHVGLQVVQRLELGVEPGLDGALAQQVASERVDGLDAGAVEIQQGLLDARVLVLGKALVVERPLELEAHARGQLAGRLLGEGDDRQVVDRGGAAAKQGDDPRDQHGGLPGPRAGLDAQVGVEVGLDSRAGGGVVDRRGHAIFASSSSACTRGSSDLRSRWAL